MLLNVDAGEHDDEPEELYALAHVVHVACGGHAGDEASMTRVVRACKKYGTRVGAHPSYVDREGFGRRALAVDPGVLEEQLRAQCTLLRRIAEREGVALTSAKPHGARTCRTRPRRRTARPSRSIRRTAATRNNS